MSKEFSPNNFEGTLRDNFLSAYRDYARVFGEQKALKVVKQAQKTLKGGDV